MTTIIKRCRGEKKRGIRAEDEFKKELMVPDSGIRKCPEFEVKLIIRKLLMKEKILEKYSVKIHEIDPYFYEHHKEKIKVMIQTMKLVKYKNLLLNLKKKNKRRRKQN